MITNNLLYDQYYKKNTYSKTIADKTVQLSTLIINASIQKLKDKNILTTTDTQNLNKNIIIKYNPDCRKTE